MAIRVGGADATAPVSRYQITDAEIRAQMDVYIRPDAPSPAPPLTPAPTPTPTPAPAPLLPPETPPDAPPEIPPVAPESDGFIARYWKLGALVGAVLVGRELLARKGST